MKKFYLGFALIAVSLAYSQQIPTELSLAVKQNGAGAASLTTPDFSYYSKNYDSVFKEYNYSFDIQQAARDRIYFDGDKFYSNKYIPVVLQQHYSSLAIDNYYYCNDNSYPKVNVLNTPVTIR